MLTIFKLSFLVPAGILIFSFGCASIPQERVTPPRERPKAPANKLPEQEPGMREPTPRTIASLRLTEQAQLLIEDKKADQAIRLLEKAVNIDPNNGRNYYFLAEAWLLKGNKIQASEFNRMAGIYLENDPAWISKVSHQKELIEDIK